MKVLICHPSFWIYGGAERVIVKFCNYCSDHHIQTTILTTQMKEDVRKDLIDTRLLFCVDFAEMVNVLKQIHIDFDVIFYNNHPCELMSYGIKNKNIWLCNEPQSFLDLGYVPDKEKEIVNNFIDKVIVADEFNQKRFKELYGMDSEIINYGVDYDFFSEKIEPTDKYDLKDSFVITQVGFIHPTKNTKFTYEIFKEVLKKIPNAKLLLVGKEINPYAEELRNQIMQDGNIGNVIFTGVINREEVRNIYNLTDIVLMPVKSQGSWLSPFEAISAGCIIIVSKEMTASSILEENGLAFVCDKIEDYIDHIVTYFEHPISAKDMFYLDYHRTGRKKQWVKKNLTWDKFSEKVLEVMK
jgi:glycosyltransferase involved in cell wall biosynthesis